MKRALSFKSAPEKRSYKRRGHDRNLSRLSSTEIISLEQSVETVSWQDRLKPFVPLISWAAWIILGAIFYGFHDNFNWAQALYMSVNVGWSMGWVMEWEYERTVGNTLFSTVHTSVGVVFIGIFVIYIAQEVGKNKDDWIMQMMKKKDLALAAETEGYMDDIVAFFTFYLPKLKIFIVFVLWFVLCTVWYRFTLPASTNGWELLDFVISLLSGGGYLAIDTDSTRLQYVFTSLYTTIGVPLMSIALGLLLSLMMEAPEDKSVYEKIVAGVTEKEIEFMKIFGIDDGDGTLDSKEFIILTVVRIGAAPPQLISQIHSRFAILDRQHKGKIDYDDLVLGRKRKLKKQGSFGDSFRGILRSMSSSGSSLRLRSDSESSLGEGDTSTNNNMRSKPNSSSTMSLLQRVNSSQAINKLRRGGQASGKISPCGSMSDLKILENGCKSNDQNDKNSPRTTQVMQAPDRSGEEKGEIEGRGGRERSMTETEEFEPVVDTKPVAYSEQSSTSDVETKPILFEVSREYSEDKDSHISSENVVSPFTVIDDDNDDNNDNCDARDGNDGRGRVDEKYSKIERSSEDGDGSDMKQRTKRTSADIALSAWNKLKRFGSSAIESASSTAPPLESGMKTQSLTNLPTSSETSTSESMTSTSARRHLNNKSSRRALNVAHSFDEITRAIQNKEVSEKMQKAKQQMEARKLKQNEYSGEHATSFSWRTKQAVLALLKNPYFFCFSAWLLWLLMGTIFYTIHEGVSVARGVYMSVSVGYGIFWVPLKGDNVSRIFTTLHFVVGIFAIALAMAIFARTLISAQKNWYAEALNKRKFEEAQETEGYSDDVKAAVIYYWPKLKAHVYFWLWTFVGIVFCMSTGKWGFVDSLHFSISAMSTGGFLNIEDDSPEWHFAFVAVYVIVGVPVMAIACGLMAHQVASMGKADKLLEKINAQVTEDELQMMTLLNIEDGDGSIDSTEFTILILVRIGALNPDLIGVLYERFNDLDVKNEGKISYSDLQLQHQEEGKSGAMKGMVKTGKIHTRLGYG
mmetsp:Transcript_36369/g.67738  ORF Transcript_36369/g.67738 Transcript_36369/m.67738 type:complete len:1027 (-) Transcript_36369:288-3368(-)